jgi:hypothetical protein
VSLVVAWLIFPLVVSALAYGCGLLVNRIARTELSGALVAPLGLATIIVVAQLLTTFDATAELATPLVVALAVLGVVLSRGRPLPRPSLPEAMAALAVFVVYAVPVVASGEATIAGYTKLEDGSTFLALTEGALHAGRGGDWFGGSSYLAFFGSGEYPVGSLLPFGIGGQLLGEEIAWLFQPYLALLAGMLALALQPLCEPVVKSPWRRAFVAFVAAQAALLFGFGMWGGIKELSAAFLLPLAATLLPQAARAAGGWRGLLPVAIVTAATVAALSFGAVAWLGVPLAVTLVIVARSQGVGIAAKQAGIFALICAPLVAVSVPTASMVTSSANRDVLTSDAELGTLLQPLNLLQGAGVWLGGDFRFQPEYPVVTLTLIVLVLAAAIAGIVVFRRMGGQAALLYAAGAVIGSAAIITQGGPWLDAKALATMSPVFILLAMAAGAQAVERGGRFAGWAVIGLVSVGVLGSNALAYREVSLAPRDRFEELAQIGEMFAGQGPALMTRAEPYANRYFLRRLAVDNAAELRFHHPIKLRSGRLAGKLRSVDVDELAPSSVARYRLLVLRHSPVGSRPPSSYALAWRGRWYDVWKRTSTVARDRLAFGSRLDSGAAPSCSELRQFARGHEGARLAAAQAPSPVVAMLSKRLLPDGWRSPKQLPGAALPTGAGTVKTSVVLPRGGPWTVWIGGGVAGRLSVSVDGRPIGAIDQRVNRAREYERVATAPLAAGRHRVAIRYEEELLAGSSENDIFGPLAFTPAAPPARPVYLPARDVGSLCGRRLDWIEVVPGASRLAGQRDRSGGPVGPT